MGTWETETSRSSFDAQNVVSSAISNRDAGRTGSTGAMNKSGGFLGFGGYSVVGMNVESVESMQQVIREYVAKIQTHLDGIDPLADASGAFRSSDGEVERAVTEFVNNVKLYCKNLTSDLLAFNTKLGDVKAAWIQTTGNLAGTITQDTNASDAGTAYQE